MSRQVAVPMEWVVRTLPGRVLLGVGRRELDQLPTYSGPALRPLEAQHTRTALT
jgi:hypothetical protein